MESFFLTTAWQILLLYCLSCSSHYGGLANVPIVGNIAVGRSIIASSTCGLSSPEQYCSQTSPQVCDICDSNEDQLAHSPKLMIDHGDSVINPPKDRTWWQSENIAGGPVYIDLSFNNKFFFTHVIISFKSLRPALMEVSKSNDFGSSYQHLQYYSVDCKKELSINSTMECTTLYSSASPGEVIYKVSSNQPDLSDPQVLESVTLTNLKISLLKSHFSGGNISDPRTLPQQFYAIYNIEVFGWCFCSGHEKECTYSYIESTTEGMVPSACQCSNNTAGANCQYCLPLYNSTPWKSGFDTTDVVGCQMCDCNNHSDICHYYTNGSVCQNCQYNFEGDQCQYCASGYYYEAGSCIACNCNEAGSLMCLRNNGSCLCKDNVMGHLCDQCKPHFYNLSVHNPLGCQDCPCNESCEMYTGRCPCQQAEVNCCPFDQYHDGVRCISCDCHTIGSYNVCSTDGKCVCKPGVGGDKCDKCLEGYHSLSNEGCKTCDCNPFGSTHCNNITGQCECVSDVTGDKCDKCPSGTLGPVRNGVLSCIPCFCNGFSFQCVSQPGWYWAEQTTDDFKEWLTVNRDAMVINNKLRIHTMANYLYIKFPMSYLKDKRTSYGLHLSVNISYPSCDQIERLTLQIEGTNNRYSVTLRKIFTCNDAIPLVIDGFTETLFYFERIPEDKNILRKILSDIKSMKIHIKLKSLLVNDYVEIASVSLPYATNNTKHSDVILPLIPAPIIESCDCPASRIGHKCDFCAQNFTQEPASLATTEFYEFAHCGNCFCHYFSHTCDPINGACFNCSNNRAGPYCEKCASGYYYKNSQCIPCMCPGGPNSPNQFAKTCSYNKQLDNVVCNCSEGFSGDRCDKCAEGYHGNPTFENGTCSICRCSNNSIGRTNMCDSITGMCLCDVGYIGINCEFCEIGYYGNALSHSCEKCDCNINGSVANTYCNSITGQCICKENVIGRQCTDCDSGYWNLNSGSCTQCGCYSLGSISSDCDKLTGQCECKDGYNGQTCATCKDGYWNNNGTCTECECISDSSVSQVCDKSTGICTCRPGVSGTKCDHCISNVTNELFPLCEMCNECSTMWNEPISRLEASASSELLRIRSIDVRNISHTEVPEIAQPVLDLIKEIRNALDTSINLSSIILQIRVDINSHIFVIEDLIQRAKKTEKIIEMRNQTLIYQLQKLQNITKKLSELMNIYKNITDQKNEIRLTNFSQLVTRIITAVNSSNHSHYIAENIIIPIVNESQAQVDQFSVKNVTFANLSQEIIELIQTLRDKLIIYKSFVAKADKYLCGKEVEFNTSIDILSCDYYSNSERCVNGDCGGIGCEKCGGDGLCNGSVTMVTRAANLTDRALQVAKRIQETLEKELMIVKEANNISITAKERSILAKGIAEKGERNLTQLLSLFESLETNVVEVLNSSLPDLEIINVLSDETLGYNLSSTPEEIAVILKQINDTIAKFSTIGLISDLKRRAQKALNVSIQANMTAVYIIRTVNEILDTLKYIESQIIVAENRLSKNQRNVVTIQRQVSEISSELNAAEDNLNRLFNRTTHLNNSVQEIKRIFDRNSLRLNEAKNLSNETSKRVLRLQKIAMESETKSLKLKNETIEKQTQANEDLRRVEALQERMRNLRKKAHEKLLNSRNLQNRKSCLLIEQEEIKDDIKRIAAELESLHNSIQTTIGRNTLCMRKSSSGK